MKSIKFSVELDFIHDIPNEVVCEESITENIKQVLLKAVANGDITPSGITASGLKIKTLAVADIKDDVLPITYPLTEHQAEIASEEGWTLSETENLEVQIQRCAESDVFKDDNEAVNHIIKQAMLASPLHQGVLMGLKIQSPEEFELWVNEARVNREFVFDTYFTNHREQCLHNLGL